MKTKSPENKAGSPSPRALSTAEPNSPGRIFSAPDQDRYLDSIQLSQLENSFREWIEAASRFDVIVSRRRILLIFLLIRCTGAKLNEVLRLDPGRDIDFDKQFARFGRLQRKQNRTQRNVQLPEKLCREIRTFMSDPGIKKASQNNFSVDPGFVRRKFYERAEACGIAKRLGAPEVIRRARAVELIQNNMPLPAVQALLGHSTPNLTSAYVSFSEADIQHVTRLFMEKESTRKTSARNSFYGKIQTMRQGDIQTLVEIVTLGGHRITTVITNDSRQRLGLKVGKLITAEVKAPWVMLQKSVDGSGCSADNVFKGIVERITPGKINTEFIVRISDGTEVCSMVTSESCRRLALAEGDEAWVSFNGYSVVLLSD